ncbi:hypothetical protein lerEdw1_002792 [Lerista edwardsae]|nr:hypothetical protein lerEdw1_002792 [Lerista edwardsae]
MQPKAQRGGRVHRSLISLGSHERLPRKVQAGEGRPVRSPRGACMGGAAAATVPCHNKDGARPPPSFSPPLSAWPRCPALSTRGRPRPQPSFLLARTFRLQPMRTEGALGRPGKVLRGAMEVAGARTLSALLAGRSKKQNHEPKSRQQLQEEALRMLSSHQDLGDLLLEVGSSLCEKPSHSCHLGTSSCEASVPELFLVSALQDQASTLGVPVGILSARTAANNIEKISAGAGESALLNVEQRKSLSCLLQTLKDLLARGAFCRSLFAQEMWKMQSPFVLEVAWHLHHESIVSLEELLENHPDIPALVEWLCSSLCLLCQRAEDPSLDTESLGCILTGKLLGAGRVLDAADKEKQEDASALKAVKCWLQVLSVAAHQGTVPLEPLQQFSSHTLTQVLTYNPQLKVSDAIKLQREWSFARSSSLLTTLYRKLFVVFRAEELIQRLQQVLETREVSWPHVLSCLSTLLVCQSGAEPLVKDLLGRLLRKAFENFDLEPLITAFLIARQAALEGPAVFVPYSEWFKVRGGASGGWKGVALWLGWACVEVELRATAEQGSCGLSVSTHPTWSMAKGMLEENPVYERGREDLPPGAPSVPELADRCGASFQVTFGSASAVHGGSKKSFLFLFKFLSELVPFEAPQYLKVHVMHPPFVPSKYRPLLLEYVTLAKTRLADFKVAIEDMGLYEDLSSQTETVQKALSLPFVLGMRQPHCQALQDVEKAIQIFENTGKIPASVMEASIFRRSYYTSRFIPALLVPRALPETLDSRMALIDLLKRAEKIPLNAYSAYLEGCRAVKEKLLQGGPAEMEVVGLQEPLELLKAELEVLRGLIADQARQDAVPAQMAVISEKLTNVLGHPKDEDEVASLSLRIELDLSDPRVAQQDQGAVDLLLTSFCQNAVAASYFRPPDRQGPWPSLFAKMLCGHRRLLPSLFGRLCQLLAHQGPSLGDVHVIGLAVFMVHLNEARSLIPEVDVCAGAPLAASARGLSVTELWTYFLACSTGETMAFCMRFCTAAVSYCLCRFSSLSHDSLCALLHPGFVKKLQYVVPRLVAEARGLSCKEEDAVEPPWSSLFRPTLGFRKAALCLWKQVRFKALLQAEAFQLTLQEWLRLELGVHLDEDLLSAPERQAFHYWALYQHHLPAPAEAGGCDGDLRGACAVLIGSILDFCQRSQLDNWSPLKSRGGPRPGGRGSPEIHCRLQEMLLELELARRRRPPPQGHFLFGVFRKRLSSLGGGSAVSDRLGRQQELCFQRWMLLGLPPSILFATWPRGERLTLDCTDVFSFVHTELRDICAHGCSLPYDVTAHFFRGLLSTSLECDEAAQEVTSVLALSRDKCPIIVSSAARWWWRLEPTLCSEWQRLFGAPLAEGLQNFRDLQSSARSFLSSEAAPLVSEVPWVAAAFLHFHVQQHLAHEKLEAALQLLGPGAEQPGCRAHGSVFPFRRQLLLCLLCLAAVDFVSARAAPQNPCRPLLCAVSDHHLRLWPVAFYSLLFASDLEQLTREPAFLPVATAMYTQLLQLFRDGAAAPDLPGQREQGLPASEPEDLLALIKKSREFLLCTIPRCPGGSFPDLQQVLELCEELDPEVKAALANSAAGGDLLDEDLLLF